MRWPRLYAIVDHGTASRHGWSVEELGRAMLAGGATVLQVRAPGVTGRELLAWCRTLVGAAAETGGHVIVNDRVDIALMAQAAGVHLGQDDLDVRAARRLLGKHAVIGLSTHTRAQVDLARTTPVDYVAVGPIHRTDTKQAGYGPVGLDLISYAAAGPGAVPVVAIGGITLACAADAIRAGARSVAVISDLLTGGDPRARVAEYLTRLPT